MLCSTKRSQSGIRCLKFEFIPHPNPQVQCGKRPLPRLLEVFPDAKDQIVAFGIKNLAMLTIERVHDRIICKVIPSLMETWMHEQDDSTNESNADAANNQDEAEERRIHSFPNQHGLQA